MVSLLLWAAGSFFLILGLWVIIYPVIARIANQEQEINLVHLYGALLWKGVREPDEVFKPHIAKYVQTDIGKTAEKLDK